MSTVTTWSRPYRDPFRIATGFVALFASPFACLGFFAIFVVGGGGVPFAALSLFIATVAWRLHRTALVVSDIGVRVRWLVKTRTVRWHEVDGFRFKPDLLGVDRLWIDLADGRHIRTPVQRVHRWMNPTRLSDGGTWLLYDACDELLRSLESRLRSRGAAP
jgi:hypothetical protein